MTRFAAEFPDARHVALGLEETDAGTAAPGELTGMTMQRNAVMTAASVHVPPRPNAEAVCRTLAGDADWRQSLGLATAGHAGEPGGDTGFLTARLAANRALAEAGRGAWLGAFLDGTLVSQLGLITCETGLARYQSVETHPAARRRGLAGTLVWHADATALAGGTRTLVMVADPGDTAIRVYRRRLHRHQIPAQLPSASRAVSYRQGRGGRAPPDLRGALSLHKTRWIRPHRQRQGPRIPA